MWVSICETVFPNRTRTERSEAERIRMHGGRAIESNRHAITIHPSSRLTSPPPPSLPAGHTTNNTISASSSGSRGRNGGSKPEPRLDHAGQLSDGGQQLHSTPRRSTPVDRTRCIRWMRGGGMEMSHARGAEEQRAKVGRRRSSGCRLAAGCLSHSHPATAPVRCALRRLRLISPPLACASHRTLTRPARQRHCHGQAPR